MLYQLSYFRKNLAIFAGLWAAARKSKQVSFSLALHHNSACFAQIVWEVVDSNHRTLRERIYSPPQLPLCEPPRIALQYFKAPFSDEGFK